MYVYGEVKYVGTYLQRYNPKYTYTSSHYIYIYMCVCVCVCVEVTKEIKSDRIKKSKKNKLIQNLIYLLGESTLKVSVIITLIRISNS